MTSIRAPRCFVRRCHWYGGVKDLASTTGDLMPFYIHVCPAFPNGIPEEIAYGTNKHLTLHPQQVGLMLFHKGKR